MPRRAGTSSLIRRWWRCGCPGDGGMAPRNLRRQRGQARVAQRADDGQRYRAGSPWRSASPRQAVAGGGERRFGVGSNTSPGVSLGRVQTLEQRRAQVLFELSIAPG